MKKHKYKIKIKSIYPEISEDILYQHEECMIGISMSNPVFWRSSMNNILLWADSHFKTTYLVIGDFLNRFNNRIYNNSGTSIAIETALEVGDKFLIELNKHITNYSSDSFKIIRWQDLLSKEEYSKAVSRLFHIYETNDAFRTTIEGNALDYLTSQKAKGKIISVPDKTAIHFSAAYLIEELAIFNRMISEGIKVIIYPGTQIYILVDIEKGHFARISCELFSGIHVKL